MIKKEHTRNQKRMYRIHKQDEKINAQELIIASLQQRVEQLEKMYEEADNDRHQLFDKYEQLENIRKEAIEYINEEIKGNYFRRYEDEVYKMCDDLLNILNKGDNND